MSVHLSIQAGSVCKPLGVDSLAGEGVNASLGILTKQSDTCLGQARVNPEKQPEDKFAAASKYPGKFKLQRQAQILLPDKRVATCYRNVYDNLAAGEVQGRSSNGKAEFTNLWVCGSPWDCPVCSSKISASRSQMVLKAMAFAKAQGFQISLLTLTVPHTIGQSAKAVISALAAARAHWRESRLYRAWAVESGLLGMIWATEVTYGRNGWHPHNHALVFAKTNILEELREQWKISVRRQGLGDVNQHGYKVDDGSRAGEYVSKWGLEHELTRADLKKSRFGGRSPFQLLRDSLAGDEKAGGLFVEYSRAFHGRPQLLWTNGLKAALQVDDGLDEDLARASEIDVSLPHEKWFIDQASWMVVLGKNARGELLKYAAKYGQVGVDLFVAKLKGFDDIDSPYYASKVKYDPWVGGAV
jgi:hypothetical protein